MRGGEGLLGGREQRGTVHAPRVYFPSDRSDVVSVISQASNSHYLMSPNFKKVYAARSTLQPGIALGGGASVDQYLGAGSGGRNYIHGSYQNLEVGPKGRVLVSEPKRNVRW